MSQMSQLDQILSETITVITYEAGMFIGYCTYIPSVDITSHSMEEVAELIYEKILDKFQKEGES